MKDTRDYTVMFVRKRDDILLGMKKRGFGEGKYNGEWGEAIAGVWLGYLTEFKDLEGKLNQKKA